MGGSAGLPEQAAPEHDLGALEDAVRIAKQRAVRKKTASPVALPDPTNGAA